MKRKFIAAICIALIAALTIVGVPLVSASANPSNRIVGYVVLTNKGPLHSCVEWAPSGYSCPEAITIVYIYVLNLNPLTNTGGNNREVISNAYVINEVDWSTYVNGTLISAWPGEGTWIFAITPPPNPTWIGPGHWPVEVTPSGIGNPSVLPGENVAILYVGWVHCSQGCAGAPVSEPNGLYVFHFTVRGTVNGVEDDITLQSFPIVMTK
jgi:hypothetical protein